MLRLIGFLALCLLAALGLSWLADRPGSILINWEGYHVEVTVFRAIVALGVLLLLSIVGWSVFRTIWQSPAAVGQFFTRRRQSRGLDALSSGMIAIGSGDREGATRYAIQARKALPNEPLTHLLRAQAAQLTDDRATSRRIYEGMLGSRDTEALGLRGLFLEAKKEGETEAARQFADRALRLNAKLGWASDALFDAQCKQRDWGGALETLAGARKNGLIEKSVADRRRAVLLTAQAQIAEDQEPDKALALAQEAHSLAPNLVPAADIAGRLLAARGNTAKAAKILQNTWKRAPHPDLALTYAYARPGDSPRDRLQRVQSLAAMTPHTIEAPIAVATAAIEARQFEAARKALAPLLDNRLTQRVCTLMARIEGEEHGDTGRVREWLARAVNAPRDPAWTADGKTCDEWAPVSPVSGELDALEWRVPVESMDKKDGAVLTQKMEEFVALGTRAETIIDAPVDVVAANAKPAPAAPVPAPSAHAAPGAAGVAAADAAASAAAASVDREAGKKAGGRSASPRAGDVEDVVIISSSDAATAAPAPVSSPEKPPANAAAAKPSPPTRAAETAAANPTATTAAKGTIKSAATPAAATAASSGAVKTPAAEPSNPATGAKRDLGKATIFVPPRAPDDPGAEDGEQNEGTGSPLSRYRSSPVKG